MEEPADEAGEIRITLVVWALGVEFMLGTVPIECGTFICPVLIIFRDVIAIGCAVI